MPLRRQIILGKLSYQHPPWRPGIINISNAFSSIFTLLVLTSCASVQPSSAAGEPITNTAALEFVDRWVAANKSKDFGNLQPLIHPKAMYRNQDGDLVGLNDIRQSFEGTISSPDENYNIDNVRVTYAGSESATVAYTWIMTDKTLDGRLGRLTGRGTIVINREEGQLKLRLLHTNVDAVEFEE